MKANVRKIWDQLTTSEQKRLKEAWYDEMDERGCIMQFNWIKLGICSLANIEKITKEDMLTWLAGFKRLYQLNSRLKTQQELTDYLNKRMDEIFGEGGFPEEFMQSFKNIGRD